MLYFVDTNIFLRVLNREDEKIFKECSELLKLVKEDKIKIFTSNLVLAEIIFTLISFYKFKKIDAAESLKSVINLTGLKITNRADVKTALEFYENYNIKFVDAIIASNPLILQKKMKIISYDKDFDKLGAIRIEPSKILTIK